MPNLIDIRRRIRSVKSTQQITKAMKMVAASKLRRSQDRVLGARPYARTLAATLASVASRVPPGADGEPPHPLLQKRPERKVVVVTVTGDKGLCGAFNTNVNRVTTSFLRELAGKGAEAISLVTLGRKGNDFWRRRPYKIDVGRPGIFAKFSYATAAELAQGLTDRFVAGEIDAVYLVYNEFRSVISQIVRTRRLLPVEIEESVAAVAAAAAKGSAKPAKPAEAASDASSAVDYLYEPSPAAILGKLLPRHLEFQLFQALLESNAAENAARMTAMEGASKNAGELIDSLSLTYNRARQAKITKELIEIVSGAAAM